MCIPKSTISAYENDKVDIKGSVIVELLRQIDDNKAKEILLAQINALAHM